LDEHLVQLVKASIDQNINTWHNLALVK
jgi:hypothetical protein